MTTILIILPVLVLVVLVLFLLTGLFVGMGYILSLILPLSLFQASILCISTTFVVGFILLGISIYDFLFGASRNDLVDDEDDSEDDEDYEDDEEWEEEIRDPIIVRPKITPSGRVSRNAPCPCGSGKKYKNCCGKYRAT